MATRTANYKFDLVDFNTKPWHFREHDNWRQLDGILATLTTIVNIAGVWDNATAYTASQKLVDGDLGTLWTCEVAHTSASTGTFAEDRAANPTYWSSFTVEQRFRGDWVTGTEYAVNDFVVSGSIYAVCSTAHTAGATFAGDVLYWVYLADLTTDVAAAAASAAAAAASAASVDLPASPNALDFIRRNAANTEYENLTVAQVRTALSLVIGTNVQAWNTKLDTLSASMSANGQSLVTAANYAAMKGLLDLEIGTDVLAYSANVLFSNVTATLTKGYAATPYDAGTKASGTYTPNEANGNLQYAVNGGAHTLAPPTNNTTIIIQYTNNASAGAITTSGFTAVDGDTITTTDGHDFLFFVTKLNGFSYLSVKALQ